MLDRPGMVSISPVSTACLALCSSVSASGSLVNVSSFHAELSTFGGIASPPVIFWICVAVICLASSAFLLTKSLASI
jgi:hypothetical protein